MTMPSGCAGLSGDESQCEPSAEFPKLGFALYGTMSDDLLVISQIRADK